MKLRLLYFYLLLSSSFSFAGPTCLSTEIQTMVPKGIEENLYSEQLRDWFDRPDGLQNIEELAKRGSSFRHAIGVWLQNEFRNDSRSVSSRISAEQYRVVLIGAGIHNSIVASTIVSKTGKKANDILIVERANEVLTTFWGKHFRINSPELENGVTANAFPNAPFQLGRILPNERSATASDLALVAMMNYKAAGVHFLLETNVEYVNPNTGEIRLAPKDNGASQMIIRPKMAGIAIGLSNPITSWEPRLDGYFARTQKYDRFHNGVYHQRDFLSLFGDSLYTRGMQSVTEMLRGKRVLIIGNQHGAFISAEPLLGRLPDQDGALIPRTIQSLQILGLKPQNRAEFLEYVRPGGDSVDSTKAALFQERYEKYGFAQEVGQFIKPLPYRASSVEWAEWGTPKVNYKDANGQQHSIEADIVIVSTGYDARKPLNSMFGSPVNGIFYPVELGNEFALRVVSVKTGEHFEYGRGQVDDTLDVAFEGTTKGSSNFKVYVYGAGAGLPISQKELEKSFTGSPDSINILGPKSAHVGSLMAQ